MSPDDREAAVLLTDEREKRIRALGYDYVSLPKERIERCNLCGETAFVAVAYSDRYGFPAESDLCLACGLVFLNPRMTRRAYATFYERVYRPLVSAFHGRSIDAEAIEEEQEVYAHALGDLLDAFMGDRRGGRFLDIGGSTGVVAEVLSRRFGLRGFVLDPAPAEVERARRRSLEAAVGMVETFRPPAEQFSLVTMCQTVDHLLDVAGALAKARDLIEPNGLFFADIVDFRTAYLTSRSVEQATKIDHPYSLTEVTAEAYLLRAGFRIVQKDYAADHLHIGYVCVPGEPRSARISSESVSQSLAEIRFVQAPTP